MWGSMLGNILKSKFKQIRAKIFRFSAIFLDFCCCLICLGQLFIWFLHSIRTLNGINGIYNERILFEFFTINDGSPTNENCSPSHPIEFIGHALCCVRQGTWTRTQSHAIRVGFLYLFFRFFLFLPFSIEFFKTIFHLKHYLSFFIHFYSLSNQNWNGISDFFISWKCWFGCYSNGKKKGKIFY